MARHSKPRGKLGSKTDGKSAAASPLKGDTPAADDPARDPLRAYPADPPRANRALLIIAAVLFAAWFCCLAYIALRG